MKNYCPNCDQETEFACTMEVSLVRKAQEPWYTCQKCQGGFSPQPPANPPKERSFLYECPTCGDVQFDWDKDNAFPSGHKDWNFYKCSGCGMVVNLPEYAKDRIKHREWQKKGCPPPWWFRPTQVVVLLTLAVLVYFFPWWMLGVYLVGCYGLLGYMLLSGEMSQEGGILGGILTWIFAPIIVPWLVIFFAIRPPIL